MNSLVEKYIQELKTKGYRTTKLKRKLLEYFINSTTPLTIKDVLVKLSQEGDKYFKSSIYREIEKFLKENIIIEIDLLDGKKRYELNNHIHHHHAMCKKCGTVICVDMPNNLDEVETMLLIKNGFTVTDHVLEFFGVCRKCSQ